MAVEVHLEEVRIVVDLLRAGLSVSAANGKLGKFIRLEPSDLSEDEKAILGAALFEASPERIEMLLSTVYSAPETRLFGLLNEHTVVAIAGIRKLNDSRAELIHIAVNQTERRRGFGSELIHWFIQAERLTELSVETDNDAVEFYKRCGFSTWSLGEQYPGVERFACRWSQGELT